MGMKSSLDPSDRHVYDLIQYQAPSGRATQYRPNSFLLKYFAGLTLGSMVLLSEGPSGLLIGASGACNRGRRHALTLRVLYLYNVNRPPATSTENPTTSVVQYKHSTATTSSQQTTTNSTTCSHQLTTTACIGIVSYNQRLTEYCSSQNKSLQHVQSE